MIRGLLIGLLFVSAGHAVEDPSAGAPRSQVGATPDTPTVMAQSKPDAPTVMAQAEPDAITVTPTEPGLELYASISVNSAPRGSFLVVRFADGNFAIRTDDLSSIGIARIEAQEIKLDGEDYVLLASLKGAKFEFQEQRVHIAIQIDPQALQSQLLDARWRSRRKDIEHVNRPSAFLNYSYNYDDSLFVSQAVFGEIGIRHGNFLFLSDGFYERVEDTDRAVRLRTSITYDNRETLQQGVFGDFITSSGALGSTLDLGGISFSKNFRIDPYFIRYPYASYAGLASTPSQYEVLVNGNQVSTGNLEPGPFEITNIQGPIGVSDVEVVVRDAFGREQYFATPFFFTQQALRAGVNEYNFAIGARRQQLGTESANYGALAATGLYRHGITDFLTLGARAETSEDVSNFGPNITLLAGRLGLFNTTISYSTNSSDDGVAGVFDYLIQTRKFNASAHLLAQSRQYSRVGVDPRFNARIEAGTSFSYRSVTLNYLTTRPYQGIDRTVYGVSWSPRLPIPRLSFYSTLRRIEDASPRNELFAGFNYYFQKDYGVSGTAQTSDGNHRVTSSVQKAIPTGEGWGFSATASQFENSQGSGHSVRPFVQYNAKYASLLADYQRTSTDVDALESKRFAVQGSITAVDNTVMLSRPVTDAFGLVKVDNLENIRIYQGGQLAGKTDSKGRLLIPTMGSYVDNQISVDSRDVPFNFELNRFARLVSPGLRGGAVLDFGAKRIQAVAGTLKMRRDADVLPVNYGELTAKIDGETVKLPVGHAGDFFIENLPPGSYTLLYSGQAGVCTVFLEAPESDEAIVELGDVLCAADQP